MEKLQFREVRKPEDIEGVSGLLDSSVSCTSKTKDDIVTISKLTDLSTGKVAERLLRFAIQNIEWV